MALYTESVELWPEGRRGLLLAIVAVAVALLVYFNPTPTSMREFGAFLLQHWHLLAGLATAVVVAFSNHLEIELTNEQLILRIGPHSRRIPLASVIAARPILAAPGEKRASWMSFVPSYVSEVVPARVELHFTDGKTFAFSSHNPAHLAEMISSGVTRIQREMSIRAGAPDSGTTG